MSKKRLYLIIAITAIVTIGFFLAAYIISRQGNENVTESKNPFTNFFPFGKSTGDGPRGSVSDNTASENPDGNTNDAGNSIVDKKNVLALRQISTVATAGYFPTVKSGKTAVQFTERATGNIFETSLEDMRRGRISNSIIPGVQEAFWGNGGKNIVYRFLKEDGATIATYVIETPNPNRAKVEAQNATTTDPLKGSLLPENLLHVLVSSDTKNMLYLTKTPDFNAHVAFGNVFNFQKNTSTRVFQSPFAEWLPVYFDGKTAILQTKASQDVPGYLYSMNASTGELQKIIGGINGLTALPSPNLQKILYSESNRGGVSLHLYDRKEKTVLNIEIVTLPEKCVWSSDNSAIYCAAPKYIPSAEYPDAWYQGSISLNDSVWKIDPKTGNLTAIFSPEDYSAPQMDMQNLTLSASADFLFFINKNDSTLWGYNFQK